MKIVIVPWVKASVVMAIRIYDNKGDKIRPNDHLVEIPTLRGQKIALSLIQKHATALDLSVSGFLKNPRMAIEAEIPDAVAGRIIYALKHLSRITSSREIPKDLADSPTIEGLESFLFTRKLIG